MPAKFTTTGLRLPTGQELNHELFRLQTLLKTRTVEKLRVHILKRAKAITSEQKLSNFIYALCNYPNSTDLLLFSNTVDEVLAIFIEKFRKSTDIISVQVSRNEGLVTRGKKKEVKPKVQQQAYSKQERRLALDKDI